LCFGRVCSYCYFGGEWTLGVWAEREAYNKLLVAMLLETKLWVNIKYFGFATIQATFEAGTFN
jgi:hypothetical protein